MENIGDRIRSARLAAGMTMEEFADFVGLESRTLRDIEKNISEPRKKTMRYIEEALANL